jgi:hypothetical protein
MAAQTRLWRELPYTQAMRGHGETREHRPWAILDVVIFAQPSPLLHTVIASGICTAPGQVIGYISPSPQNGGLLTGLRSVLPSAGAVPHAHASQ